MDQQLHQSAAYDYRPYDRLWQRVAPGLEPYPADTGAAGSAGLRAGRAVC